MTDDKRADIAYLITQLVLKKYDEAALSDLGMPELIREYAQRLLEILKLKSLVTENADILKKDLIQKLVNNNVTEIFNIDMADVTNTLSTESAERQPAVSEESAVSEQQSAAPAVTTGNQQPPADAASEQQSADAAAISASTVEAVGNATNQGIEESAASAVAADKQQSADAAVAAVGTQQNALSTELAEQQAKQQTSKGEEGDEQPLTAVSESASGNDGEKSVDAGVADQQQSIVTAESSVDSNPAANQSASEEGASPAESSVNSNDPANQQQSIDTAESSVNSNPAANQGAPAAEARKILNPGGLQPIRPSAVQTSNNPRTKVRVTATGKKNGRGGAKFKKTKKKLNGRNKLPV